MPRFRRVVAEGVPHHVTQRGNARQAVFNDLLDRRVYLDLLRDQVEKHRLQFWAWCLMTNHIHLLVVPETAQSLPRALANTHREYARYRNLRSASCGHLWQSRYYSCPVDESGLWAVMAYIESNPVRAGMVESAEDYPWSSAGAHVRGMSGDALLDMEHWSESYTPERWQEALRAGVDDEALRERLRQATVTGRPFGSADFVDHLEVQTQRELRPGRAGRPKKSGNE